MKLKVESNLLINIVTMTQQWKMSLRVRKNFQVQKSLTHMEATEAMALRMKRDLLKLLSMKSKNQLRKSLRKKRRDQPRRSQRKKRHQNRHPKSPKRHQRKRRHQKRHQKRKRHPKSLKRHPERHPILSIQEEKKNFQDSSSYFSTQTISLRKRKKHQKMKAIKLKVKIRKKKSLQPSLKKTNLFAAWSKSSFLNSWSVVMIKKSSCK